MQPQKNSYYIVFNFFSLTSSDWMSLKKTVLSENLYSFFIKQSHRSSTNISILFFCITLAQKVIFCKQLLEENLEVINAFYKALPSSNLVANNVCLLENNKRYDASILRPLRIINKYNYIHGFCNIFSNNFFSQLFIFFSLFFLIIHVYTIKNHNLNFYLIHNFVLYL